LERSLDSSSFVEVRRRFTLSFLVLGMLPGDASLALDRFESRAGLGSPVDDMKM
jgi:hypothetical protein